MLVLAAAGSTGCEPGTLGAVGAQIAAAFVPALSGVVALCDVGGAAAAAAAPGAVGVLVAHAAAFLAALSRRIRWRSWFTQTVVITAEMNSPTPANMMAFIFIDAGIGMDPQDL